MSLLQRCFGLLVLRNGVNFEEWPPVPTKRTGGLFLVALAVPGVGVTRVARCRPDAPVRLAVGVDVDVLPRSAVRGVVVDALPAIGVVRCGTLQLCRPPSLSVLRHAGGGEVSLVELVRVEGGVRGSRCQEQTTDYERAYRQTGSELSSKTHYEPSLLRTPEEFLRTL